MKFRLRRAVSGIEYEHWLTAHPNVQFHFTPTSASWLNQVQPARGPHLVMARFACDTAWHELIDGGVAMANAILDTRQKGDSYRRVEVITGQRRRWRWTGEEKARIVAESFEEGANISEVARRNGVARGLLTVWRGQVAEAVAGKAPSFVRKPLAPNRGEPSMRIVGEDDGHYCFALPL